MKTLRKTLLLLCTLASSFGLSAQTVSGKLVDEQNQPLPYANVVLLSLPDSAFVNGTISGEDGTFTLDATSQNQIVKILAGYLVLVAVICSMAAILVHERGRMHEIETGEETNHPCAGTGKGQPQVGGSIARHLFYPMYLLFISDLQNKPQKIPSVGLPFAR